MNDEMSLDDYDAIVNEIGQNYVETRKECLTECANLFDTHEVTLAEKNCMKNCFKKITYAKFHFNKLVTESLEQVKSLNNESINSKF